MYQVASAKLHLLNALKANTPTRPWDLKTGERRKVARQQMCYPEVPMFDLHLPAAVSGLYHLLGLFAKIDPQFSLSPAEASKKSANETKRTRTWQPPRYILCACGLVVKRIALLRWQLQPLLLHPGLSPTTLFQGESC